MTKESTNYEIFTKKVIEEMTGVIVHHQRVYKGRISKRKIKVDVSFNYTVAGSNLLFLIECKCYKHSVSVDDVEEFHSKIDDIGAHKGIMVTTIGFQEGAIKAAKGRGIALALLTKDRQKGEIEYIINSLTVPQLPPPHEGFWQGNFKGILGDYDGGFRFEKFSQFLGLIVVDEMTQS